MKTTPGDYTPFGVASLPPGIQCTIERIEAMLDEMRARLARCLRRLRGPDAAGEGVPPPLVPDRAVSRSDIPADLLEERLEEQRRTRDRTTRVHEGNAEGRNEEPRLSCSLLSRALRPILAGAAIGAAWGYAAWFLPAWLYVTLTSTVSLAGCVWAFRTLREMRAMERELRRTWAELELERDRRRHRYLETSTREGNLR